MWVGARPYDEDRLHAAASAAAVGDVELDTLYMIVWTSRICVDRRPPDAMLYVTRRFCSSALEF